MSNLPLNIGITPPYDDVQADLFEEIVGNAISDTRSYLAEEMHTVLWNCAKDALDDQPIPTQWHDWYEDNRHEMIEAIFDDLMLEAKRLWEN